MNSDTTGGKKKIGIYVLAAVAGIGACGYLAVKEQKKESGIGEGTAFMVDKEELGEGSEVEVTKGADITAAEEGDGIMLTPDQMQEILARKKLEESRAASNGQVYGLTSEELMERAQTQNMKDRGMTIDEPPAPSDSGDAIARATAMAAADEGLLASADSKVVDDIVLPKKPDAMAGADIPDGMDSAEFSVLKELAMKGDASAQYDLAVAYLKSSKNNHQSMGIAELSRAAEAGSSPAIFEMARRMKEGDGMPRDQAGSYAWLTLAQAFGVAEAESARISVAKSMSESDLGLAHDRAGELLKNMTSNARKEGKRTASKVKKSTA